VWKNGAVVIRDAPPSSSTFLPNVDSYSSLTGSDSPSYTVCRLSAGSDSLCRSSRSPIDCKGSCPNPDLDPESPKIPPEVYLPPEVLEDQAICRTACNVKNYFRCGNRKAKCRCLASKVTGSLANLAGCATLGTIKALMAKQAVAGSRLGGRGLVEGFDTQFGCVCNGSYVSAACCDSDDGIVHDHGLGLGQLEL
jgi:hypothetical protein